MEVLRLPDRSSTRKSRWEPRRWIVPGTTTPVRSYVWPGCAVRSCEGSFASLEALNDVYTRPAASSTAALSATTKRIFRLRSGFIRGAADYRRASSAAGLLSCRACDVRQGQPEALGGGRAGGCRACRRGGPGPRPGRLGRPP